MSQSKFIFWCLASQGSGISGGDRIYIELVRRWSKQFPIKVITSKEGIAMMDRNNLHSGSNLSLVYLPIPHVPFLLRYIACILIGIYKALIMKVETPNRTYLYSASEFWMDSIPCWILKIRHPEIKWISTWFQTAPSPFKGFTQGGRAQVYRLNALILWLSQAPIKPLISHFADYILVNNDLEKKIFPHSRTIVVLGAVDTSRIDAYRSKHLQTKKKYAAVFQGRFHPQKGVVELIDIWRSVVSRHPGAKLAMIGDGPLRSIVEKHISDLGLEKNVDLLGYVFDGPKKYQVFSQSLIAVHPAFFDSGGMATAEAMAFGLPAVGFELPAYKYYYPKGMITVPVNELHAFAHVVEKLLDDPEKLKRIGNEAKVFIRDHYSWNFRSTEILTAIVK